MADVFISYSRSDEKSAARVASALLKSGYSVWWDADLPAHRAYSEVIETHLKDAKAVIVLWSKDAVASQWVRAEADVARNAHKLVQLSLDGTMPPLPFNQLQCASLKGWRGGTSHAGWGKLRNSVAELVGEAVPGQAKAEPRWWTTPKIGLAAAAFLLLLFAAILIPRYFQSEEEKPVVAVLPFETLDKKDASLVAGIWEDTRQAIGRNPQLLVLGPKTAEEIAKSGSKSAAKLADYLVEASVRSAGNRLRVSANLVRTKDGTELWSQSFDRQLDDVFALQSEIATEIEGHIRGRLAQGGGVKPENFATTGEVYALYTDARAKIRRRDSLRYAEARDQLREVVKKDPNFAPGWATLSVAEQLYGPSTRRDQIGYDRRAAETYARRAIALAPNLAAGHTALGFALKQGPAAEASLRRAIALDPNDFESINWLASMYKARREDKEALALYSRAVKIEPLFWPAVLNRLDLLLESGDQKAAEKERLRLAKVGDSVLEAFAGMEIARFRNDQSEAARIGLELLRRQPEESRGIVGFPLFGVLLQLGYAEEARKAFPPPPFGPPCGIMTLADWTWLKPSGCDRSSFSLSIPCR
ncbi:TIR domain-containing protein [Sphingomonas sp. HDW15A]|uniref:TIR domain-containing protein n=1 Tax=Sphingomonas sp. HDW15A TaxID=2714942 RepID=UPI00140DD001|nr:TIR domain-containing protein [Sphingomonas sp. HDW15A]QIK95794.1 TIR domain-containing protein [Sphingomonas sp. HDW15A]